MLHFANLDHGEEQKKYPTPIVFCNLWKVRFLVFISSHIISFLERGNKGFVLEIVSYRVEWRKQTF